MKTIAIVQSRMGNTRFPGKAMKPIGDIKIATSLLVKRLYNAECVDQVVLAIPDNPIDNVIEDWCDNNSVGCYRGSEEDVLTRVYEAAIKYGVDIIIEITADCPFVDPRHIDAIAFNMNMHRADYAANVIKRTWPDGLDIQIYTMDLLRDMVHSREDGIVREHVGWNHQWVTGYKVKTYNHKAPKKYNHPDWGLTLDTSQDLELLDLLYTKAVRNNPYFHVEEVLDYILQNPGVLKINEDIKRKEPGNG